MENKDIDIRCKDCNSQMSQIAQKESVVNNQLWTCPNCGTYCMTKSLYSNVTSLEWLNIPVTINNKEKNIISNKKIWRNNKEYDVYSICDSVGFIFEYGIVSIRKHPGEHLVLDKCIRMGTVQKCNRNGDTWVEFQVSYKDELNKLEFKKFTLNGSIHIQLIYLGNALVEF